MKHKSIPEQKPILARFADFPSAFSHKSAFGGWLFVSDFAAGAVWFDASAFTATGVMLHPIVRGQSGKLI